MFSPQLKKHSLFNLILMGVLIGLGISGQVGQAQDSAITIVWANDGGDKVTQDELRAQENQDRIHNSIWDGETIQVFGARNEVVAFNLILEAPFENAADVTVTFDNLIGPDGGSIRSESVIGDAVFDWTNRPIELFYVRYLEIKGLSLLSYETYDERHIPEQLRRPWSGEGEGRGTWEDRPSHNQHYPDIAVPLELASPFSIAAGQNQSIWVDVYIPKETAPGNYAGQVAIQEGGNTTHTVPVQLTVRNFTLPETSTANNMVFIGYEDINQRYYGETFPEDETAVNFFRDRHFLLAHRHRIALIGDELSDSGELGDSPNPAWIPRLDGSLFTPANGYAGPGVGVGNGVYSIGTYGSWSWQDEGEAAMHAHTDAWVNWFDANAPNTEYFLYLVDESEDFPQTEQWASWIASKPRAREPHASLRHDCIAGCSKPNAQPEYCRFVVNRWSD